MKELTIVMPFLNEGSEPHDTINSILQTANPDPIEIIAIDDGSSIKSILPIRKEVKIIRNKERIGSDVCRQIGINEAKTPYVFLIDAHMRFPKGWYEPLIDCVKREPNTAWCTSCMELSNKNMNLSKSTTEYTAATLLMMDSNADPDRPAREVLEPKWIPKKEEMEYEIPCILGANYLFTKEWISYIKGLEGLTKWGTTEPFLSLKTWMAGGKCKISRRIRIGHKFRDNAPYSTPVWTMVYNKMYLCKTILPEDLSNKIISCMPKDNSFELASAEIIKNKDAIQARREYYNKIFTVDIRTICNKFDIILP